MPTNVIQTRLEQAFAASGLTQAELSRLSGIDRGSISLYLSGRYRPKADKLLRLAGALGVSAEWLSGMEEGAAEPSISFPVVTGAELTPTGERIDLPRSELQGGSKEDFFLLRMQGLAMYPRILEGDYLLVRRMKTLPEPCTCVVVQDGVLLVRQNSNGLLLPVNPELPPRPFTDATVILGRAVKLIRAL